MGPPCPRGSARAARGRPHPHLARSAPGELPCALSICRGDESMPLRLSRTPERPMPLHARPDRALPESHLWAAARSHRPADRGPLAARGGAPGVRDAHRRGDRLPASRSSRLNRVTGKSMSAFVSYAQNGEDFTLWCALHDVDAGTYIDIGAYDPDIDSVTRAFYDRGWSGINIEPV